MSIILKEITKFPVITDIGEYKVTIDSEPVAFSAHQWRVRVYEENTERKLFGSKFNLVYTYKSGWGAYKDLSEDLVGLARTVVTKYEEEVAEDIRYERMIKESVDRFEKWDGRI